MLSKARLELWSFLAATLIIFGHILVVSNSLPLAVDSADKEADKDLDELRSDDVVDPSEVRSKRQVDYYNSYYYDTNLNNNNNNNNINNNCGFRRFLTGLGLGINNYYSPYYSGSGSSSGYNSRNRRLLRNRQPFLYNGRRGLYPPSRYFSYSATSSSNNFSS